MELGPIQKAWVDNLRKHPERQATGFLGRGIPESYTACCLGEGLVTYCKMKNIKLPFIDGFIIDFNEDKNLKSDCILDFSYKELGLRTSTGRIIGKHLNNRTYLTQANDSGVSWPEIADFIEENPEAVFTHSV